MRIWFGKKFHAAGLVHGLQLFDNLRGVHLQLLNAHSRQRERHLEVAIALPDHFLERVESRHVRSLHDVINASLVLVIVVIIMVRADIEESIPLEMYDLMYLEV